MLLMFPKNSAYEELQRLRDIKSSAKIAGNIGDSNQALKRKSKVPNFQCGTY
jgi:hypothetical protein